MSQKGYKLNDLLGRFGRPDRLSNCLDGEAMIKRGLFIAAFLLFLFTIPPQVFALSCVELDVTYFLTCEAGSCDGFKVREEFKGGGCQRVPYVVDLKTDEAHQIHDHLYSVTEQIEMNGSWRINMDSDCASALRSNKNDEHTQRRINDYCHFKGDYTGIEKLADSGDYKSLQVLREREEKNARTKRVSFYFSQAFQSTVTLLLGAILPLLVVLRYLRTRRKSFIPYIALVMVAQISIIFYLVSLFVSLYLDWASFSLVISVPLFLIEIGLLIGAKLENRHHKTRLH
jgi:hypothetical protein